MVREALDFDKRNGNNLCVGMRKWADVVKGSLGPTSDHNYVGTIPINNKYTISQNTGLKMDRRTTLE